MKMQSGRRTEKKTHYSAEERRRYVSDRVATRLVLNFSGFENTSVHALVERLARCAEQTGKVFGFTVERSPQAADETDHASVTVFTSKGSDWRVDARLVQFGWFDIVAEYENAAYPTGFLANFVKYLAFFADGTVLRYMRTSKLYFLFSIYPLVLAVVFAAASLFAADWIADRAGLTDWMLLPAAVVFWLILCRWPGRFFYLPLTISDWGFARDMVNRSNPQIDDRMELFSRRIAEEISASSHDEIVISTHSFGSLWAIGALTRALEENPSLLEGKKLRFLALGSSHLKIALCPKASWMRDQLKRLLSEPTLFWHEFQSKDDAIAFYKSDPFTPIGLSGDPARYKVDRVRFKRGMELARYRRMKRSLYRTHGQYVRYYDYAVDFDFGIRLFGPFDARSLAATPYMVRMLASDSRAQQE